MITLPIADWASSVNDGMFYRNSTTGTITQV